MSTSHKLTVVLAISLALLLIVAGVGWESERVAAAILSTQQKADREAEARIADNQAKNEEQLKAQLADLATQKKAIQTPAQVVRALPQVITLPAPIVQITPAQANAANAAAKTSDLPATPIAAGDLIIPAADAKPFYDAQVDCKANLARLNSCSATVDNQTQLLAVKEENIRQLQTAVKGGTRWQRTVRALKYAAIGAAVGAGAAAYAAR